MNISEAMRIDNLNYSETVEIRNKIKKTLINEMNKDKELEKKVNLRILNRICIYGSEINEHNLRRMIKDLINNSEEVREFIIKNYMYCLNVDIMNELLDYRFEY